MADQPHPRIRGVFDNVALNEAKLTTCPGHDFVRVIQDLQVRYMCTACGGDIDAYVHKWYLKGIEDGARKEASR